MTERGTLIFLWCVPRGRSSVLLRCLSNRENCKGYFEPLYSVLSGGPEGPLRNNSLVTNGVYDIDESVTLANLKAQVEEDLSNGFDVIIKDFGFSGKAYIDALPVEEAKHVFLTRHPALIAKSWMAAFKKIEKDVFPTFMKFQQEIGRSEGNMFQTMEAVYNKIKARNGATLRIDSKDLQEKPGEAIKSICEFAGLSYSDTMLSWKNTDGAWPENFRVSKPSQQRQTKLHFAWSMLHSDGIHPGKEGDPAQFDPSVLTEQQRKLLENAQASYLRLDEWLK